MTCLADVVHGSARWVVAPCDNRFGMGGMPDACVDAVVCDPPYELGFMGKRWDASGIAFDVAMWSDVLRVLKPGGHLIAFGGTRTYHRLTCAIEDSGFDVRDCLCWLYGSGFPKSLNVSKAIDAALGAKRAPDEYTGANFKNGVYGNGMGGGVTLSRSDPCTAAAAAAGYGTALKPAFEPAILARKPLSGTVAASFMEHGTGALNIDGCRIEWASEDDQAAAAAAAAAQRLVHAEPGAVMSGLGKTGFTNGPASLAPYLDKMDQGRWPANVILDEAAAALLDAQAGDRPGMSGGGVHRADYEGGMFGAIDSAATARNDNGGPSRFFFVSDGKVDVDGVTSDSTLTRPEAGEVVSGSRFHYTAKASRSERDAGLDGFATSTAGEATERADGTAGLNSPRAGSGRKGGARNTHPTVKPVDVMRWLVRLVSRPGSLILDPFCGSGSTGIATMLEGEGRRFIGMELDPKHVDFARARIAHVVGGGWRPEMTELKRDEARQPGLFDTVEVSR